jgi:death-on-curing protein
MHEEALNRWGGKVGGGHRGGSYEGVEGAVQAVKNSYYTALEELAAAYAVYIVQGHVFLDGNKRSGLFAMTTFLRANFVKKLFSRERLFSLMFELQEWSEQGARTSELVDWLANEIAVSSKIRFRSSRTR